MRKVLSFVLVLAMILGSVSMAFATDFSDTTGKVYAQAAATLNELGVISGYADGTFGGEKNITRAEFATMVVNALGFITTGSASTGFTDVPVDYWAAQAIKTAKDLGIVYGKTATTFDPKANITNDEAVAMLVRALGYKAEYLMGSYPASYVNQAMSLGILKNVATGSAPSTRGNVASLIFNALGENTVSYTATYAAPGISIVTPGAQLIERLGYTKDGKEVWTGLDSNLGAYGTVYHKTDKATVKFFIPESQFVTGTLKAPAAANGNYTLTQADGTVYYVTSASGAAMASITNAVKDDRTSIGAITTGSGIYALKTTANADGTYDLYSKVVWTGVDDFASEFVQEDIKDAKLNGEEFVKLADGSIKAGTYLLNGVAALTDIKEDDVVTVYVRGSGANANKIVRVDVSDKTVEGTLQQIAYNKALDDYDYYVDATAYGWAGDTQSILDKSADLLGSKGTFYFNYAGKITAFEGETEKALYAIVVGAKDYATNNTISTENAQIELFLADGTTQVFNVIAKNGTANAVPIATASSLTSIYPKGTLVKYALSDGKVCTLAAVGMTSGTAVSKAGVLDGKRLVAKTVVFSVNPTTSAAAIGSVSDLYGATALNAKYYDATDDGVIDVIAYVSASVGASKYYVFGDAYKNVYKASGNYYTMDAGFVDGEAVETFAVYQAATSGNLYTVESVANGVATLTQAAVAATATYNSINTTTLVLYTTGNAIAANGAPLGNQLQLADKDTLLIYYVKNNKVYKGNLNSLRTYKNLKLYNTLTDTSVYNIIIAE